MIKLCVFDLAGTTIKDDGGSVNKAFRGAFIAHNYQVTEEEVNEVMGLPKPQAIRKILFNIRHAPPNGIVEKVHQIFVGLMKEHYRTATEPVDGAFMVFNLLHMNNIKVAIDTGFSKDITDVIMNRLGWVNNGIVDAVCSSDEVQDGRPYPDMIQKIMRDLSLTDVKQVAKIGDTPADLQEGQNAGCGLVIGVTEGSHTEEQLKKHYHTHLIPNIKHLIPLL